jgi:aminoglycoside phosphotransferase (APT) family kinase protein
MNPHDAASPSPPSGTPAAEVDIDAALVRALLTAQHRDLAALDIEHVDAGWDNAMFRLGETLSVRLPRRLVAAGLIEHEQRWLPTLARYLPLPVPAPVRVGRPGEGYPWSWSVLPWLDGGPADLDEPGDDQGEVLGRFLKALHGRPLPPDAPENPVRGVPLLQRQAMIEERMARASAHGGVVSPRVRQIWAEGLAAPMDTPPVWLHGDLHAKNVLTLNGRISAVVDWGDMCGGDPATDLASIWVLLASPAARREAMAAYGGACESTWARAEGWATAFGVMLLDAGLVDDPRAAVIGERTLSRLAAGG